MPGATQHFKNCLGVFQGGGCKALAFVGAYGVAYDRGVFFSRVAGTSAGAVVAAFIAAGASPAYLVNAVQSLNFASLLHPPDENVRGENHPIAAAMSTFASDRIKKLVQFSENLGLFSSAQIESWLDIQLRALLPNDRGPVTFADLNIPLHVVATDVESGKSVVWSTDLTPDVSVAYAVRCSCTIPLLFQPVAGRYVDGGMVSNLPSFALSRSVRGDFEKLLCFTFSEARPKASEALARQDPFEYLLKILGAAVDGGAGIQFSLQSDLHVIEIGSLPLGTLDFGKVNAESIKQMFDCGAAAACTFFDSEATKLRADTNERPVLLTEPQTLNQIIRERPEQGEEVWISLGSTRYVYNLFPTLLYWTTKGAKLIFVTTPEAATAASPSLFAHERFRRLVLQCLGASILEVPALPFEGVLFRKFGTLGNAIILDGNRATDRLANFAVKYDRQHDSVAIDSMISKLQSIVTQMSVTAPASAIRIEKGGADSLFERLRNIEQYKHSGVTFTAEEVDLSQMIFLTKYVKSYKYGQVWRLFELYESHGIGLFEPAQIHYGLPAGEVSMPLTPPVAEEHGGRLFLIEGNSRLAHMIKERRAERVRIIVVRNVSRRLPTTGQFSAGQLLISDEGKIGAERYEGWTRADYRPIEEAARPPNLYVKNNR
jgi:hypothetical protein